MPRATVSVSTYPVHIRAHGAAGGGQVQHPSLHVERHPRGPEGHRRPSPAARRQGHTPAGQGETRLLSVSGGLYEYYLNKDPPPNQLCVWHSPVIRAKLQIKSHFG